MADIKNLALSVVAVSTCNGEEQVQFIPESNHQMIICPPPPSTIVFENLNSNLNNVLLGDSQNNLPTNACHSIDNVIPTTTATTPNGSSVLARKVSNHTASQPYKKAVVTLTHLAKRPLVDIEFKELAYSVPESRQSGYKTILKSVQGKFRSGELTAIMGPSGAGKSTLMNVLAGYKTSNLSGSVLINGKNRTLRKFRKMSCYIMQDDQLLPHLTVLEAMTVAANLKLGKDVHDKRVVIDEIIETLGLSEASHTRTNCLSGGQRKRLSIALELVNNPPVMFFDEPTSGLDSSTCFQCLSLLKTLSRGGRTIICTIHQPSARLFEMFDHLYILAEGQCIYQGAVGGLVPFLSSMNLDCPSYHNPADYVMEVASGEHGECVEKLVSAVNNHKCDSSRDCQAALTAANSLISNDIAKEKNPASSVDEKEIISNEKSTTPLAIQAEVVINGAKSPATPVTTVPSTNGNGSTVLNMPVSCTTSLLLDSADSIDHNVGFPTSFWTQFWILMKRTFVSQMRDTTLTRIRLISHIIVGFLIGGIYYDIGNDASKTMSNAGCLFFTIMFIMFTAMMPTILTFPLEMGVFVREHLNYWYSLKAFYMARTLSDIPFQIAYSVAYVVIVYFMTSQPLEYERFFMYLNICVLTSLVAQAIGLFIGAAMSVESGVFIGPVCSVPLVIFSGFFINLNAMPIYLKFLPYISFLRYGFEGTMITVYGYDRHPLKCTEDFCIYKSPRKFLMDMSMDKADYWVDTYALLGFLVVLRIVAYFVLKLKIRSLS